jgi:hypothetical protein
MSESFDVEFSFLAPVRFLTIRFYKYFSYIKTCKKVSPIVAPPDPRGPLF